ncbi:MAG: FAD-binding protein, partial [Streptosporangiaceae bacterium]
AALGASAGATRVVTDAGWMSYDRQIGTTGVSVNPELYIAFGISGAAQHVGGLGAPEHLASVNTDPSCPMTAMANLGIVADAPAVLAELAMRLGVTGPSAEPDGAAPPGEVASLEGAAQPAGTARPEESAARGEGVSHAG